jgi:hypothetical protein
VHENIRSMIETAPLTQPAEAYVQRMEGQARFRMVRSQDSRVLAG